jgi:hypothetical protein
MDGGLLQVVVPSLKFGTRPDLYMAAIDSLLETTNNVSACLLWWLFGCAVWVRCRGCLWVCCVLCCVYVCKCVCVCVCVCVCAVLCYAVLCCVLCCAVAAAPCDSHDVRFFKDDLFELNGPFIWADYFGPAAAESPLPNTYFSFCFFVFCTAVLCCAVLCCAVLCCAVLCCAVLCCVVPCRAVLCCTVCWTVLCCAVICCAECCAVLCAVLWRCMLCLVLKQPRPRKGRGAGGRHLRSRRDFTRRR